MKSKFAEKYGEWAVVAGASEGLGAEFARQLAGRGLNLLLIARRESELQKRKVEFEPSVQVQILVADLSKKEDLSRIADEISKLDVGLFIYNAVFPLLGNFIDKDIVDHEKLLDVNCRAPMILTHHVANKMVKRGKGGIILMSSMAGLQGSAVVAHYAASKAYNQILAEGLWYELKDKGVDVLAAIAGATSTPNFLKSEPKKKAAGSPPVMNAEDVVSDALKYLGKRPSVVTGTLNRIATWFMSKIFSRKKAITIISKATSEMYPHYME